MRRRTNSSKRLISSSASWRSGWAYSQVLPTPSTWAMRTAVSSCGVSEPASRKRRVAASNACPTLLVRSSDQTNGNGGVSPHGPVAVGSAVALFVPLPGKRGRAVTNSALVNSLLLNSLLVHRLKPLCLFRRGEFLDEFIEIAVQHVGQAMYRLANPMVRHAFCGKLYVLILSSARPNLPGCAAPGFAPPPVVAVRC